MTDNYMVDNSSGKIRKADDVDAADYLMQLKQNKDQWVVIEALIKIWLKRSPEEFKGFKIHIKNIKETRLDPKFGQTKSKKQERRLTLIFPLTLQKLIRTVYKVDELQFDKKFFGEFGKRYKMFQIPERI